MATTRSTLDLLGLEDHPHRALAELLDHLVAGDLKLSIGLAGFLHQPRHLAAGQDLGLDHDLQQALGKLVFLGGSCLRCDLQASISAAVASPRRRIDFSSWDSSIADELLGSLPGRVALDRTGHQAVSLSSERTRTD